MTAKKAVARFDDHGLTPQQEKFAQAVASGNNRASAYREAYPLSKKWKDDSVHNKASALMRNAQVSARVSALQSAIAERAEVSASDVLREAFNILMADPRELVSHVVHCCRYCYGKGFLYQRTAQEFERDRSMHAAAVKKGEAKGKFSEEGGIGYDERLVPNQDCPSCFGRGVGRVLIADTRNVSKQAASLYAGIKQTKDGIEVKLHSRLDVMEKLFKHFGLYEADNKQKGSELDGLPRELLQAMVQRLKAINGQS
jgi:phage terminase small subunit